MSHPIDPRLLDRYLAGECSPSESAEVVRWIEAAPRRAAMVRALRERGVARAEGADWNVDAAWRAVAGRLPAAKRSSAPAGLPARRSSAGPLLRAAAVLVVAAGATLVWRGARPARDGRAPAVEQTATTVTTTGRGERREVRLPDGSRVVLGVESRLEFPRTFGDRARDVVLRGEAYFRVSHDANRPFSVRTAGSVTRVLGTEFDVRAYTDAEGVRVVVASGRVSLRPSGSTAGAGAELTPGQLGELDAGSGAVRVREGVDVQRYVAWTEGRLVFDDVPLRDVLPQLSRWFDADLAVRDSALAAKRLSASFRGEPLPQVLDAISLALNARYERAGRTITFLPAAGR